MQNRTFGEVLHKQTLVSSSRIVVWRSIELIHSAYESTSVNCSLYFSRAWKARFSLAVRATLADSGAFSVSDFTDAESWFERRRSSESTRAWSWASKNCRCRNTACSSELPSRRFTSSPDAYTRQVLENLYPSKTLNPINTRTYR